MTAWSESATRMRAYAAALTWAYLFPADAAFHSDDDRLTPVFRSLLEQREPNGRDVQIVWGSSSGRLPRLEDRYGLVAVNCRGISARDLQEAGFTYVRRLAVVPSLAKPRWFVPLDSRAAASAGFRIHTPTNRVGHVKLNAVRAAARLGLPGWYRDTITIAQRAVPPIEQVIQSLFPESALRLTLSTGDLAWPDTARGLRVMAVNLAGEVLAFGKLASSRITQQWLENEAAALKTLTARFGERWSGPRLLSAGEVDGTFALFETPVEGALVGSELSPAHWRFLASLQDHNRKPVSETALVRTLAERVADLPPLASIFDSAMATLAGVSLPVTITHGDFAPCNVRWVDGSISAFDWENAVLDGLPMVDAVTYRLASIPRNRDTPAEVSVRLIDSVMRGHGEPNGLSRDVIRALAVLALLANIFRSIDLGRSFSDPEVTWVTQIARELAMATSL